MATLRPSVVSSRYFHRDGGLLVAEASDLLVSGFGQVYDDACDEGLTIRSERTGREVVFVVESLDRDREGDVAGWRLLPADLRERREIPTTVLIIND